MFTDGPQHVLEPSNNTLETQGLLADTSVMPVDADRSIGAVVPVVTTPDWNLALASIHHNDERLLTDWRVRCFSVTIYNAVGCESRSFYA